MATEILKLTAQVVISHASITELSPTELVEEIKEVYNVLSSLECGVIPESMAPEKGEEAVEVKKKPSIPLKDIVQEKFVVCLECGRKMKSLKVHLQKGHGLTPKEYFWKYDLDPKQYPLVARDTLSSGVKWLKIGNLGKREGGRRRRLE